MKFGHYPFGHAPRIELPLYFVAMNIELAQQIAATYVKHGWKLQRVLMRSSNDAEPDLIAQTFPEVSIVDADLDAIWFARGSHTGREAWELRLISEQPYALFEAFEADESEEDRHEARHEMENTMREHARG